MRARAERYSRRMQPVILRTERLELSLPREDDIDAIVAAAQDPEVPRWTGLPSPYTREHAQQFVEKVPQWWDAASELTWAVRRDGQWIGMIGLHDLGARRDHASVSGSSAEIGYWLAPEARGQGYVTEAARAVIDFSFTTAGLARIEWRAVVGNTESAHVARKLGFRYEGLLRQGLTSPRGRSDGWIAALLPSDDRTPQPWPVPGA